MSTADKLRVWPCQWWHLIKLCHLVRCMLCIFEQVHLVLDTNFEMLFYQENINIEHPGIISKSIIWSRPRLPLPSCMVNGKYTKLPLLVFIVFKAELSDDDLDVRLGGGLEKLLQPDEAPVVLVQDGEALPAKTCYQIRESLAGVITR